MSKKFAILPRHLTIAHVREVMRERRAKEKFKNLLKNGKPRERRSTKPPAR